MQEVDYAALYEQRELSVDAIKTRLPIAYVMEQAGYPVLEVDPDGREHCLCPFHSDSAPSFDIFGNRWGCFPCGISGDVLDLVGRLSGLLVFGEIKAEALKILQGIPPGWEFAAQQEYKKRDYDPAAALRRVAEAGRDDWALTRIADHYGWPPAAFLKDRWRVGSEWTQVIIPYFDRQGHLVSYKRRRIGTHTIAASGATFPCLYGEWLDLDPSRPVLLCEGESDTWAADYTVNGTIACLGVPGAATKPLTSGLERRHVTIAFDGDESGRKGAQVWAGALEQAGAVVNVWDMPDGSDLRQLLYEGKKVE